MFSILLRILCMQWLLEVCDSWTSPVAESLLWWCSARPLLQPSLAHACFGTLSLRFFSSAYEENPTPPPRFDGPDWVIGFDSHPHHHCWCLSIFPNYNYNQVLIWNPEDAPVVSSSASSTSLALACCCVSCIQTNSLNGDMLATWLLAWMTEASLPASLTKMYNFPQWKGWWP